MRASARPGSIDCITDDVINKGYKVRDNVLLIFWGEEGKGLGFTIFHHIQDTIKCVNPTIILWSIKKERKTIFFQLSYVTLLIIWLHLGFLGHKSEKCLS